MSDGDTGGSTRPGALRRLHTRLHRNPVTGLATKVVVTVVGVAVLGAGLVMMVTPGPGIVGIIVGLAILALEWSFAERWMNAMKERAKEAAERARDLDPAVRRRRILVGSTVFLVVGGGLVAYLLVYGWPEIAVDSWDWVQDVSGVALELPGM